MNPPVDWTDDDLLAAKQEMPYLPSSVVDDVTLYQYLVEENMGFEWERKWISIILAGWELRHMPPLAAVRVDPPAPDEEEETHGDDVSSETL